MLPLVRRTMSARASMALLVGLLLAPVLASAVAANFYFLDTFNQQVQEDARLVARRVSDDVDREIDQVRSALSRLGTAPALSAGNVAVFTQQAAEIGRVLGIAIALEPRPAQGSAGDLAVSGVGTDDDGRPSVRIAVPVRVAGLDRDLAARFDPARFVGLLVAAELSNDWTVALVDVDSHIVARSRLHDTFVGKTATASLRERTATGDEGVWTGTTLEGTEVLSAFVRSPLTGWRAAVGIPTELVEAPRRRSLLWLVMVALIGLGGSIAVATLLGGRIARSMTATAAAAKSLARSEPLAFESRTTLRELAEINTALVEASRELERRAVARDRYERDLLVAASRLERVLNTAPVGILEVDDVGTITLANDAAVDLLGGVEPIVGRHYGDPAWGFGQADGSPLGADQMPVALALKGERIADREIALDRPNGDARVLSVNASPIDRGRIVTGAIVTLIDVSIRHQAERRRQLLINELNHRVKNTLASVQSIAEQTLRAAATPAEAQKAIGDRLRAMAGAHDLLTRSNWEAAELLGVIEAAISPFRTPGADRFVIDAGPPVHLAPRAALPVVLALHELATNAVKYGALSAHGGTVTVTWTVDLGRGCFLFDWIERGGPPVVPPSHRGFGSRLLQRGLAMELDAVVEMVFADGGLTCHLAVPLAVNTVPQR